MARQMAVDSFSLNSRLKVSSEVGSCAVSEGRRPELTRRHFVLTEVTGCLLHLGKTSSANLLATLR